ncbi:DUF4240 domain-containing protein [Paractinoplanes rishiriensis]|uniref:DUF4240 domain-containing protein n=1 Tax=Paractinoplanes rishiriensis TaxID=1050105 RepID=A0A919K3P2_9ACTN|nr:DUF4240 domain-containing protein [Actinoplanes rishiriensis]GIE98395.1 hypothetical protein Ari01nite_58600 [Actinoplanes rishiriensis]
MDEQTFWDLVDRIGHDPADFDRLADELSDHSAADIRDFADHLARALHALDTPAHYRAVATSGTSFLGVRCAAVAAGASAYRQVLSAPATLASFAGRPGTQLLPLAERAYRTSTRNAWQHQPAVSTRTGSNVAAWGDSWLRPHMGTTTGDGRAPRDYMIVLRHVALTLDADPAWRAWWRQSGLSACELGIVAEGKLDHLRPSADIRRFDDRLKANFTCALPTGPDADLPTRAVAEVRAMFEVIGQAMSLPALPPTPPVPALPSDVPEVPVTTKALPSAPQDLEAQGYLTLAQIQEFFG